MNFKSCKIILKSQADKKEFLKACKHIHDFTVLLDTEKKLTYVKDEWGDGEGNRLLTKNQTGISLNFEKYPFINFLAGLYDCDNKKQRDKFILIQKSYKKPSIIHKVIELKNNK